MNFYVNGNDNNLSNYSIQYINDANAGLTEEEIKAKEEEKKRLRELKEKILKESVPGSRFRDAFYDYNEENDKKWLDKPLPKEIFIKEDTVFYTLPSVDPNEAGRRIYSVKSVYMKGNRITPLIGCNGAGKSTLIEFMSEAVVRLGCPLLKYDNLQDGGHQAVNDATFIQNYELVSSLLCSSEGENILQNFSPKLGRIKELVEGKYTRDDHCRPFRYPNHVFVFIDAIDSGFSIDNILYIKSLFHKLIDIAKKNNKYLYIIVAANSFEMARNEHCWDVQHGKEFYFGTDYEKYREFVIESRRRIMKQWSNAEKKNKQEE